MILTFEVNEDSGTHKKLLNSNPHCHPVNYAKNIWLSTAQISYPLAVTAIKNDGPDEKQASLTSGHHSEPLTNLSITLITSLIRHAFEQANRSASLLDGQTQLLRGKARCRSCPRVEAFKCF